MTAAMYRWIAAAVACFVVTPLAGQVAINNRGDSRPLILTISGGVSQGAYQAGANWMIVEYFRSQTMEQPGLRSGGDPFRLEVVTGASAGNINSIFTAIEWCRPFAPSDPESSLFYRMWVGSGIEQLLPEQTPGANDTGVFNRDFARSIFAEMDGRLADRSKIRTDCTGEAGIPIGITMTRLHPAEITVADEVEVETQRLATTFRLLREPSDGRLYFVSPSKQVIKADAAGQFGALVYMEPERTSNVIPSRRIYQLNKASSSFPLFFAPVTLGYYDTLDKKGRCPEGDGGGCAAPIQADFIDGGAFDNNPLDLGLMVMNAYRSDGGKLCGDSLSQRRPLAIFIDPDNLRGTYGDTRSIDEPVQRMSGLSAGVQLVRGFLPTARQYELQWLGRMLERCPSYGDSLQVSRPTRGSLIAGKYMMAMGAFFGRPLREYDFYVGMYDGLYFIAHEIECAQAQGPAREACTREKLAALITNPPEPISHGARAPLMLRMLYEHEMGTPLCRPGAPPCIQDARDREFEAVMGAIRKAAVALDEAPSNAACRGKRVIPSLLCTDGFDQILDNLRAEPAGPILQRWSQADACKDQFSPEFAACRAERTFARLVRAPETTMAELLDRGLSRIWLVEQERSDNGDETFVGLMELARYLAPALGSRSRTFLPGPSSSVPRFGGFERFWYLAPSEFSKVRGGGEAGWVPTVNLGSSFALLAPIHAGYYAKPLPPEIQMLPDEDWRASAGFSAAYMRRGVFLWAVAAGPVWEHRLFKGWDGSDGIDAGFDLSTYLAAGKIKANARHYFDGRRVDVLRHWEFGFGVADLSGFVYWLLK